MYIKQLLGLDCLPFFTIAFAVLWFSWNKSWLLRSWNVGLSLSSGCRCCFRTAVLLLFFGVETFAFPCSVDVAVVSVSQSYFSFLELKRSPFLVHLDVAVVSVAVLLFFFGVETLAFPCSQWMSLLFPSQSYFSFLELKRWPFLVHWMSLLFPSQSYFSFLELKRWPFLVQWMSLLFPSQSYFSFLELIRSPFLVQWMSLLFPSQSYCSSLELKRSPCQA